METGSIQISTFHKKLLDLILSNKYIVNNILMGNKLVGNIEIHDNGSISFYTKERMFKWLCILFGDYKTISFRDLALNLIDIISGPNTPYNSKIFDGMSREFMDKAVKERRYEYIIDMLFDVLRYGVKDGEYSSKYLDMSGMQPPEQDNGCMGRFHKQKASVILSGGDVLGSVDIFTRVP